MRRKQIINCRCLWCKLAFTVPLWRIVEGEKNGHRRGVFCSEPCRRKVFKSWLLLGMRRDKEYQLLLRERAKLRRLVQQVDGNSSFKICRRKIESIGYVSSVRGLISSAEN